MNQVKQTIRTFVRFNNRTFECGKYAFVPALEISIWQHCFVYLENSGA